MAKLLVTYYARMGRDDRGPQQVGEEPNLGTIVVDTAVAGGVAATDIPKAAKLVRLHASDGSIAFVLAKAPTAPAAGAAPVLPQGAIEYFGLDESAVRNGLKIAAAPAA